MPKSKKKARAADPWKFVRSNLREDLIRQYGGSTGEWVYQKALEDCSSLIPLTEKPEPLTKPEFERFLKKVCRKKPKKG